MSALRAVLVLLALGVALAAPRPLSPRTALTLSNPAEQSGFSSFDLLDLPAPSRAYTTLASVPSICAQYTGAGQECAAAMQAFSVALGDCGSPWTVCRCTTANITLEEAVDHLARVPVGLRRNVGTVMVMPDTSAHAYTLGSNIHYFGVCSQKTWIHESSHAADHGHSSTSAWTTAVGNDTNVPDTYSQTNYVEDFAQVSVLEVYKQLHGSLPSGFTAAGIAHQLAYLEGLSLYNHATLFGNTCAFQDDWSASALHTTAPASLRSDGVIPGSYTTLRTASTVTAIVGTFAVAPTSA